MIIYSFKIVLVIQDLKVPYIIGACTLLLEAASPTLGVAEPPRRAAPALCLKGAKHSGLG